MAEMTAGTAGDRERVVDSAPAGGKGLRPGALGLISSIVIGTASVAPATIFGADPWPSRGTGKA